MIYQTEFWGFLSGLGLFLFGMFLLEQGLRGLGSRPMKKFLREQTGTPLRGVFTGTIVTAILQSSSLVGLIVLAFIGAGMLELRNALGVILGSNLGSTFTGWMVTIIGFKLDLVDFARPILAVGALTTVFISRDTRAFLYGNVVLGMGLLLLGLGEMTASITGLAASIDMSRYLGHSNFVYFIGGVLFTAVVRSSSITIMILLSALHSGVITIHEAAPVAIGADLGTTSTILLAALKGEAEKRRVALSHFFFNLVTDLTALLMLPLLLYVITDLISLQDPLYTLVAFHSIFNLIGIVVFIPLLGKFMQFLEWLVPERAEGAVKYCTHIHKVPARITDAAIEAVRKELFLLIVQSMKLNLHCFKLHSEEVFPEELRQKDTFHQVYEDGYARLKRAAGEILGYTYAVQTESQDRKDLHELIQLNHALRNVSYATKFIKDIRHNLVDFRHAHQTAINTAQQNFQGNTRIIYHKLSRLLINKNPELAEDHFLELKTELRAGYEKFIQNIYAVTGEDNISAEEKSSLLNLNRATYLSITALMEAVSVYLRIDENHNGMEKSPVHAG